MSAVPRPLTLALAMLTGLALGCGDDGSTQSSTGGAGGAMGGNGGAGTGGGAGAQGGASPGGNGGTGGSGFAPNVLTEVEPGGALALITNQPRTIDDCPAVPAAPCDDLDQDGLTDAWEEIALERLRPIVRLDEEEKLVDEPGFVTANVGRVTPADPHLLVFIMLGYERDFGSCGGFTAHNGDSERVVLELEPDGSDAERVRVRRAYTAAHEGTINDQGRIFEGATLQDLVHEADPAHGDPRWVVFSSADKHATYGTVDICEGVSPVPCIDEDCAPDGVGNPADYDLSMPFVNAGEPDAPLVSDLAAVGFPGDDAWADQDFCGGLGGSGCSSSVRSKLTETPF